MWGLCVCPVGRSTGQRPTVPTSSHSSQLAADFPCPSSCSRPSSSHPWTSAVACSLGCCSSSFLSLVHPACRCHINALKTRIDMWSFSWSFNGKALKTAGRGSRSQLTSYCSQFRSSAQAFWPTQLHGPVLMLILFCCPAVLPLPQTPSVLSTSRLSVWLSQFRVSEHCQ